MKIYTVFLSLIFCIFVNSQSLIDECKELDTLINNNFAEFEFNRPDVDQFDRVYWVIDDMSYGVNNPIQYKRSKSNNLYVDIVSPEVSQIHMIGFGEEVYSINGLLVSKMTDEEIDDEVGRLNDLKEDLEIVIIDIEGNLNGHVIQYTFEQGYFLPTHFDLMSIEKVDSASSSYKSRFRTTIEYSLMGLDEIAKELIQKLNLDSEHIGQCNYSQSEFTLLKLWVPELINPNIVSLEGDSTEVSYKIVYAKFFDEENIENFGASIIQITDSIATFKGNFNYKSFPFDKQTLTYNFESAGGGPFAIPFFDYGTSLSNKIKLYDWTIKNYQLKSYISNNLYDENTIGISYEIDIERNFIYFITKIYLPIIIILLMSFSVLWIKPSSLDSRLQVGVVCFLALITFTFIVDQELPKLSYLTIMDLVILTSYVFAAITTIESIYIARYVNDYDNALKIDSLFKKLLPIGYLLMLFIIIFVSISANPNTIEALKATT